VGTLDEKWVMQKQQAEVALHLDDNNLPQMAVRQNSR
jgi:hypothetical protein